MMYRKKHKRKTCTTAHFLAVCDALTEESKESIRQAKRPSGYNGVNFKNDLSGLPYGGLLELFKFKTDTDWLLKPMQIIEGFTEKEVLSADIAITAGYMNWCVEQVEHIVKLFEQLSSDIEYTSEEIQAGVKSLNFGDFGVVDSYARRMGITNHDEVLKVPWSVIYQTMKIDNDTVSYQRRLQKIQYQKSMKK